MLRMVTALITAGALLGTTKEALEGPGNDVLLVGGASRNNFV